MCLVQGKKAEADPVDSGRTRASGRSGSDNRGLCYTQFERQMRQIRQFLRVRPVYEGR